MFLRATFSVSLLILLLAVTAFGQFGQHSTPDGALTPRLAGGHLTGTIYDASGATVGGIRVELRDAGTGVVVASTYCQETGSFELYNIPEGTYQVMVDDHGQQGQEMVSVHGTLRNVDLHLKIIEQGDSRPGTVSAAQLMVPHKARDAYEKAKQAFAKKNAKDTEKYLGKALDLYPRFAEAVTLQGLLALQANDAADAEKLLLRSIEYDPNYGMAYTVLSSVYNGQGRYDDAVRTSDRGMALSPDSWQPYFEASKAYYGKKMYARCLQLADKAQSLGGDSFLPVHMLKAYALIMQKLYRQAAQEVEVALSKHPKGEGCAEAQQLLAKLQQAVGSKPARPPAGASTSLR